MDAFEQILGDVYDCAVNPDLWPQTLERIRAMLGCAYVMFGYVDMSMPTNDGIPMQKLRSTSWDATWFQKLERWLTRIPGIDAYWRGGVDVPWVQMDLYDEPEFRLRNSIRNGFVAKDCGTA